MPASGGAARAEGEAAAQPQPDTSATGAPAASAQSGTTTGATTEEAEASATAGSRQPAEPEAAGNGRTSTQTASAAAPDTAVAAGVGGASGEGAARGGDEPPSGNPKKPFLAAAGIAGVVLLAVPLLIWVTGDSEKKDKVSVVAKSDTILKDEPMGAPQGDYAADKPKAEPKPKVKPKPKVQAKPDLPNLVPAVQPPPSPPAKKKSAPKKDGEPKKANRSLMAGAPKAPANTAASAVQQLATQSPGRHICYRAFVANSGWQPAVCDGALAGTEGRGIPIKALDISVAGTNGTSATAYYHGVGWKNPWKTVANGTDLYLGTASSSAVSLSGFAISVREGNICQNTHVSESGWLGLGCDTPQTSNNYIFGGAVEKKRTLEGVRFTV